MKYWVYMNGEVPGSYTPEELSKLHGFSMTTMVCPAEGEILEKNWRRSGEFPDIIKLLHERDASRPPSAPAAAQEAVITGDVNKVIDTASARLFNHVSTLMKELETRREEKALTITLQRQVMDLKEQVADAQEKSAALERSMPRIRELEDIVRKSETVIINLEAALKAREDGLAELRVQMEKTKIDLETNKRRLGEAVNDLSIRNRLVDKLSRDLTDKELSLAKSLAVIRRLEEDLNRLCPAIDQLAALESQPAQRKELEEISAEIKQEARAAEDEIKQESKPPAVTSDEPPPPPPPPAEPLPESPAAQSALVEKFKKLISRYDH